MDTVFQICAAFGGTLVVCQFLMALMGLGGEHGDAHDGGGGDGQDSGGEHASTWIFGELTIRTVSAGLAFFGLAGMAARRAGVHDVGVVLIALSAGFAAFYAVSWMLRFIVSLNEDGGVSIHQSIDREARVTVAIPGDRQGSGKIHVEISQRTLEYRARTPGPGLASGTAVRIVDILSHDTVEVLPLTDAAPPTIPPPAGKSSEAIRSDSNRV